MIHSSPLMGRRCRDCAAGQEQEFPVRPRVGLGCEGSFDCAAASHSRSSGSAQDDSL